jgi:hypothetical protein
LLSFGLAGFSPAGIEYTESSLIHLLFSIFKLSWRELPLPHFLDAKLGQQKELQSIRKEQKLLDQSAAHVLEENLEISRALRRSVQELQDQMDQDLK